MENDCLQLWETSNHGCLHARNGVVYVDTRHKLFENDPKLKNAKTINTKILNWRPGMEPYFVFRWKSLWEALSYLVFGRHLGPFPWM